MNRLAKVFHFTELSILVGEKITTTTTKRLRRKISGTKIRKLI